MQQVALCGYGKVEDRLKTHMSQLRPFRAAIQRADMVLVAGHSQGVMVGNLLLHELVQQGWLHVPKTEHETEGPIENGDTGQNNSGESENFGSPKSSPMSSENLSPGTGIHTDTAAGTADSGGDSVDVSLASRSGTALAPSSSSPSPDAAFVGEEDTADGADEEFQAEDALQENARSEPQIVCMLAMAGLHHGPFPDLPRDLYSATKELFVFCHPHQTLAKR